MVSSHAQLHLLVAVLLVIAALRTESAVVVLGGTKRWTTGFDYDAWATTQSLQFRVGDSLVFSDPDQSHHTVNLLHFADAYQSCTNHSMTIAASLESKALYAVGTGSGHCIDEERIQMKAAALPALKADTPPTARPTASDPNDADVNRYICWTIASLLFVACFWNSS